MHFDSIGTICHREGRDSRIIILNAVLFASVVVSPSQLVQITTKPTWEQILKIKKKIKKKFVVCLTKLTEISLQ